MITNRPLRGCAKLISLLLLLAMLFTAATAAVAEETMTVYVTVSNGGSFLKTKTNTSAAHLAVQLTGQDTYTLNDVFAAAHTQYYSTGADGYATEETSYGTSISKLWGVESANGFGYVVNGAFANGLTDTVASGDNVECFVYKNAYPATEAYAAFDKATATQEDGESVELTLKMSSYDENYNMTMVACAGAKITVDGTATGAVTDENGKASVSIAMGGDHIVSATLNTTVDGAAATAITAPVCIVTVNSDVKATGTSGNTTWTLHTDGTLEFSAVEGTNGEMGSASNWSPSAWVKNYAADIKSVVINEGVTSIGYFAFKGLSNKISLSLPSTLTSIGTNAFYNVTFSSITAAEGCAYTVVDNYLLSENGTKIYMVIDATKLTGEITVPEGIQNLNYMFAGSSITAINFPSTLTVINNGEFKNCTKLESVTVPMSLTKGSEFYGCSSLKTVTLAEGVTSIGNNSFYGCTSLETVSIPATLTSIDAAAFKRSYAIKTFNVAEGSTYSFSNGMLMNNGTAIVYVVRGLSGELVIPEGVTEIGGRAFVDFTEITSVKFPYTLTTIGDSAFDGCEGIESLTLPEGVTSLGSYAFSGCTKLTTVNLPSTLTKIGDCAFYKCSALTSVTLPDSLTSLGTQVFGNCTALTEITVPCSLPSSVFSGCTSLKTVTVKEGATEVGWNAFYQCTALETVNLPSTLTKLDTGAFNQCTALKAINVTAGGKYTMQDGLLCEGGKISYIAPYISGAVTIPDTVTEIGSNILNGNTTVTSLTIPVSVTTIANEAFYQATALKEVTLPEGLTAIGDSWFGYCTALEKVNIPSTVTSIGKYAFQKCTALKSIELPNGLVSIDEYAFAYCSSLQIPTFPSSLTTLGFRAFYNCKGATGALYLPGTIISFGANAFEQCTGITSVYMENCVDPDNATYGKTLFHTCTGIQSIRLPENLTSDQMQQMLYRCTALTTISYPANIKTVGSNQLTTFNGPKRLEFKGVETITSCMQTVQTMVIPSTLKSFSLTSSTVLKGMKTIYYAGSKEDWNAVTFSDATQKGLSDYGVTIIYGYDTESTENAPEILTQPQGGSFEKGSRVTLSVEINKVEGTDYYYQWFCDGEWVSSDEVCAVAATEMGTHEYYCIVTGTKDGVTGTVTTETVTVIITEETVGFEGSGTEEDPYLIQTTADLDRVSSKTESGKTYSDTYFKITADIAVPDNWTPIGASSNARFAGTIDGDGHTLTFPKGSKPMFAYVLGATVKNLNIYGERIEGYGLVNNYETTGITGTAITIDNVTLKSGTNVTKSGFIGANMTMSGWAGVSAGYVVNIKNCTIESGVTIGCDGDQSKIGGFAGRFNGTIENCKSYATVKGIDYVGGIAGARDNSMSVCSVKNCTFGGTVISTGSNAGGIIGGGYLSPDNSAPNGFRVSVDDCTVTGTVKGNKNVGGILGGETEITQSWDNGPWTFTNNTMTGKVSGSENVGAIIGYMKELNKWGTVSGNTYSKDCGASDPVGKAYVIDTSCEDPTPIDGVVYINTSATLVGVPTGVVKSGYNRTDDPLGKDIANLFSVIGGEVTLGDVDEDGDIDMDDVMLLIDYTLEKETLTEDQIKAADVDENGEVNMDDAMQIIDYTLLKITEFTPAA